MAASVDVSVEVLQECMIQEVTMDGQEIYIMPLSMSDNLTKMAHKIDFSKEDFDLKNKQTSETIEDEEEEEEESEGDKQYQLQTIVQPSLWPWDSVRNKLRSALTEITVLQDILTISRDRQYITLDFVQHDTSEAKSGLLLVARKKAMQTSGGFINGGLDRMKKNLDQIIKNKNQDFHYELLKLRKTWRLKKVGTTILGDLSYKSVGSCYWHSGTFEVLKTDSESIENDPSNHHQAQPYQTLHPSSSNQQIPNLSNLNVTIPDELNGTAYIRVVIKKVKEKEFSLEQFFSADFLFSSQQSSSSSQPSSSQPSSSSTSPHEQLSWTKRLELAQNVIFCREIFAQLSQEALKIQSKIPNLTCGNHIVCHLFPNVKLFLSLCITNEQKTNSASNFLSSIFSKHHNAVLEHSLSQLLRDIHHTNNNTPMPHPVSQPLGLIKRKHLIGPGGYTKGQIANLSEALSRPPILEQFVGQARYCYVREKVMSVLDEIVLEIHEPQLYIHTSYLNSTNCICLRVSIIFSGFEINRTCFAIYVYGDRLEVACKDGLYLTLPIDRDEIRSFVMKQVMEHYIFMINMLAKLFDWKVISLKRNCHVPAPVRLDFDQNNSDEDSEEDDEGRYQKSSLNSEKLRTCVGILVVSPYEECTLSISCCYDNSQSVMLSRRSTGQQQATAADISAADQLQQPENHIYHHQQQQQKNHVISGLNPKWQKAVESYDFVDMNRLPGKNFAQRLELLMAALMPDYTQQ